MAVGGGGGGGGGGGSRERGGGSYSYYFHSSLDIIRPIESSTQNAPQPSAPQDKDATILSQE